MATWFPLPETESSPHPGHGGHLCVAHTMNFVQTNLEEYKDMVRNPAYVCRACGRASNKAEYLCAPEPL